jgi:hypothetical protein
MKPTLPLLLLALVPPAAARGIGPQAAPVQEKLADPVAGLRESWDAISVGVPPKGDAAKRKETERLAILERANALIATDPRGDLAVRVRAWMITSGIEPDRQREIFAELIARDSASPALVELADELRPQGWRGSRAMLETLVEKAGDRTVRARALKTLADHDKRDFERVRALKAGEVEREALEREYGAVRAQDLGGMEVDELQKKYVATLQRIVRDYGDVVDARGRKLGARAEGALFELHNLQIGMPVPDIEGEDIDGAKFKLSDYRGKVIVLDFWGHW